MGIVPLKRATLCGIVSEKAEVLAGLQSLGVMHLVALREAGPLAVHDPTAQRRVETACRHLDDAPRSARAFALDAPFELAPLVSRILDNRAHLKALRDRDDELQARIEALEPWGDIVFPPLDEMGGQRLWFYLLPAKERAALSKLTLPWQIVDRTGNLLHVVVIAPDEPPPELLPVARVPAGAVPRSALKRERDETLIAIEQAEAERTELTRWRPQLALHLAAAADSRDLESAASQTIDRDNVFAAQGWVPADDVRRLEDFAAAHGLALLIEEPSAEDRPPTLLAPPEKAQSGAELTRFYKTPAYRAWDPSLVVFGSFALFFAMILGDAGYAAVIAVATAVFWRRLGRSPEGRSGRILLATIAAMAIVYGVACGSYFGLRPPKDSVLATLAVVDVHNFDAMMALSICVGALHITIALAALAWKGHSRSQVVTSIGWIVTIWSGIGLWLVEDDTGKMLATAGLVAGPALVVAGAMMQEAAGPRRLMERVGSGALALSGITKLFGDVLSYLRLFALGLASASLATTFNALAADVHAAKPGVGVLFAILILAFGHGINFLLGLMSGVVHGLRLNFIEFFSWGLAEEGTPFSVFARRAPSHDATQPSSQEAQA